MVFLRKDTSHSLYEAFVRMHNLIGESPDFVKVVEQCISIAPHDTTVLLVGETGTGKELCARAIHQLSPRAGGPFIPVDCAALPENLFAHELFGHEKGAFTDAHEAKKGLAASAAGGTLFLDEVESLSNGTQGALLRLVETKMFRSFGSHTFKLLNSRIIAATNQDLLQRVQPKVFRSDLYYRLTTSVIELPALRDRREDIPILVRHYLSRFSRAYQKEELTLSDEVLMALCTYDYPGNIRELQNILQQAVIRASGPCIGLHDLPFPTRPCIAPTQSWKETRQNALSAWEKAYLSEILSTSSGNIASMARQIGLSRQVLHRLLKRYQLLSPPHPKLPSSLSPDR